MDKKVYVGMSVELSINGHIYHGKIVHVDNQNSYTMDIPDLSDKDREDLIRIKSMEH